MRIEKSGANKLGESADTHESSRVEQEPIGLQYKAVLIAGLSVAQRKMELDRVRAKMEAKGWTLDTYHDEGWSKSEAKFTRPLSAAMVENPNKLKAWHYVVICIGLVFIGYLIVSDDAPKPTTEPTPAQAQAKLKKAGEVLLTNDIENFAKATVDVRREAVTLYVKANSIPENQEHNFYNFVTERIYGKEKLMRVSDVLDQAKKEMVQNSGQLKRRYYDLSGLKSQFSSVDGTHIELRKYVLNQMHDPASFEHIETRYGVVPYQRGNPPYIKLMMAFRGKNGYGALVRSVVIAKADIYSGAVTAVEYPTE